MSKEESTSKNHRDSGGGMLGFPSLRTPVYLLADSGGCTCLCELARASLCLTFLETEIAGDHIPLAFFVWWPRRWAVASRIK